MATCRECLHQELCDTYSRMGVTDVPADDITICELFKPKSDYVKRERGEWISVKDRLPFLIDKRISRGNHYKYNSERVLCVCKQESGKVMVKEGYYEMWNGSSEPIWKIPGSIDNVTHWQSLPEPPKEREEI